MKNKIQSQEFEQECSDFPDKKQVDDVLGAIEIKSNNSEAEQHTTCSLLLPCWTRK